MPSITHAHSKAAITYPNKMAYFPKTELNCPDKNTFRIFHIG